LAYRVSSNGFNHPVQHFGSMLPGLFIVVDWWAWCAPVDPKISMAGSSHKAAWVTLHV
jgi:hypothetical protein